MPIQDAVILSAVRLPTGRFQGALSGFTAPQLGALVVREAVRRARIRPADVDECILGNVVSAGLGQAPARQAALAGGLSAGVGALTINKVCGSGLKAVMLAAQGVATGDIELAVAGGMESMTNAPYLLDRARSGLRLGHGRMTDAVVHDGLWCAFENWHMGRAAELVAAQHAVSREAQDAFAVGSHRKASDATERGAFSDEILPVEVKGPKGAVLRVERDECIRADTSLAALAALKPAFLDDGSGTVTAGNAPPLSDGASALVVASAARAEALGVQPMARIVGQATSGLDPAQVLMTPVPAIGRLLAKVGWSLDSVDLFEINEAFAAQMVAVIKELRVDGARVNVNGGGIALGHPIGASGARVLTTLVHALADRGLRRGVAALCLGGGNGVALAIERM
ncbi:MAG TPA: acetyl-CoA C-acyltransferase [Vicinamibacterales bacterium]